MGASPSLSGNEFVLQPVPEDFVDELQRVQKTAQTITSILDLDQLIDRIVNDVARSLGCLEASVFLHDKERQEMVLAALRGCTVHGKGDRLKIGQDGMVDMSLPPAGCTTRPMSARTRTISVASPQPFPKLPFRYGSVTNWSGCLPLRIRTWMPFRGPS